LAVYLVSDPCEGHPDKIADQISDALIDNFLAFDANSKVACETLVTTGQVILAGEVKSNTYLDVQSKLLVM
jgi:S-adenosylmethionine synthetase